MTAIAAGGVRAPGAAIRTVPLSRITAVELRKMFDTRSGFWLIASIAITAVLATVGVILFAPDDQLIYSTFATAIRFPVVIILPLIAILAVTSEWSQRTGLTTFTLIPHRYRIINAKVISSVLIAVAAMALTFAVGAIGNLLNAAITGARPIWDVNLTQCPYYVLGMVLSLLVGFMLGVLFRASIGAVVAYFNPHVPATHDVRPAGYQRSLVPRSAALGRLPVRPERPVCLRQATDGRAVGQHRRHRPGLARHSPAHGLRLVMRAEVK